MSLPHHYRLFRRIKRRALRWITERRWRAFREWYQAARLAEAWTTITCLVCQEPASSPRARFCASCGTALDLDRRKDAGEGGAWLLPEQKRQGQRQEEPSPTWPDDVMERHAEGIAPIAAVPFMSSQSQSAAGRRLLEYYNLERRSGGGPRTVATRAVQRWNETR